ncbi:uncharacterized protein DS421_20g704830 [Arachis hypogaea]|nr:uncharacterized protein DS421_20g704830 [Arachis hypogaea]
MASATAVGRWRSLGNNGLILRGTVSLSRCLLSQRRSLPWFGKTAAKQEAPCMRQSGGLNSDDGGWARRRLL